DRRARVIGVAAAALATGVAMLVTHAVRAALGMHAYPLGFGRPGDVARFMLALAVLYAAFTSVKEALLRVALRGHADRAEPEPVLETSALLYVLGGVVGAPMQLAAYAVYAGDSQLTWVCVMLWSVLVNAVIAREVGRMWQVGALLRELAVKERLAAIGETTARIVHQTRHQLGLIGFIVHRIERRIGGLPEADLAVVRGELAKLGEVQDELRRMLARDLRGEPAGEPVPRATYAALIRRAVARLDGLAAARGVIVEAQQLTAAEPLGPRATEHIAQALFNVLENAIVAARGKVQIAACRDGAALVLSIADDGPGLAPAIADTALDPFATTKPDGTGMGLPIARAAIGEEGGALRIGRAPGGGLAVDFVVPVPA
ncbi:MAG TPA: sensor histidine kinase, partial [Kofleriaceae bacterium]